MAIFLLQKGNCNEAFFKAYCVFSEQQLQHGVFIATNFISMVSDMYLLKDGPSQENINYSYPFFMVLLLFQGSI